LAAVQRNMQTRSNGMSRSSLILAFSVAGLLAACGQSGQSGQATGSTCPADSALSYENFGQAFIQSNCLACHASREQPTLTSLSAVQAHIGEIDQAAAAGPNATNTTMPEGASVSTEDRTRLGEWLACGAP
jgi:mono/diheme cytochrome c family protein